MIFVTVGTHEQGFDRLLELVDSVAEKYDDLEFVAQTGYSHYKMQHIANQFQMTGYSEMQKLCNECQIIITHGGPASIFNGLSLGKPVIAAPRYHVLGEHVNDHQVKFISAIADNYSDVFPYFKDDDFSSVFDKALLASSQVNREQTSHTHEFNLELQKIIKGL
jgi:UDP-N-acetylglucosamine transferase subunit ALG13